MERRFTNLLRKIYESSPECFRNSKIALFLLKLFALHFLKKVQNIDFNWKKHYKTLSESQWVRAYESAFSVFFRKEDVTETQKNIILKNISGTTVLDVGSGASSLPMLIQKEGKYVVALDCSRKILQNTEATIKIQGFAEYLPFKARSFDTVISTHTFEHVRELSGAVAEVKRVAKKRIIMVVPLQKPSIYTPDYHVNFFQSPKDFSDLCKLKKTRTFLCDGDIVFIGDK